MPSNRTIPAPLGARQAAWTVAAILILHAAFALAWVVTR